MHCLVDLETYPDALLTDPISLLPDAPNSPAFDMSACLDPTMLSVNLGGGDDDETLAGAYVSLDVAVSVKRKHKKQKPTPLLPLPSPLLPLFPQNKPQTPQELFSQTQQTQNRDTHTERERERGN